MRPKQHPALPAAIAAGGSLFCAALTAADVAIYGGATWDSTTGSGYTFPSLPGGPGHTAGIGKGVGSAHKRVGGDSMGRRALRWDASGAAATELGHLGTGSDGSTESGAYAINAGGTAVGFADKYEGFGWKGNRAVRWAASGTAATELGVLGTSISGYSDSRAYAVSPVGTATGYARKYVAGISKGDRAVRWNASGTAATELGHLGTRSDNFTDCYGYAVNLAGTIVGTADKYVAGAWQGRRAVRWAGSGTAATELGNLGTQGDGFAYSYAHDINNVGTAVGMAAKYDAGVARGARAVRWAASGTAATELGHLGTDSAGVTDSIAVAINAVGTAVGFARKYEAGGDKGYRAVRWAASGTAATELGNLGTDGDGFTSSSALAISPAGTAVGYADKYDAAGDFLGSRAVLWGLDGAAVDLNTLLSPADAAQWTLIHARCITDLDWVTGFGRFDPDGLGGLEPYERTFLMRVPAPGGAALLGLGMLALVRRARTSC